MKGVRDNNDIVNYPAVIPVQQHGEQLAQNIEIRR